MHKEKRKRENDCERGIALEGKSEKLTSHPVTKGKGDGKQCKTGIKTWKDDEVRCLSRGWCRMKSLTDKNFIKLILKYSTASTASQIEPTRMS